MHAHLASAAAERNGGMPPMSPTSANRLNVNASSFRPTAAQRNNLSPPVSFFLLLYLFSLFLSRLLNSSCLAGSRSRLGLCVVVPKIELLMDCVFFLGFYRDRRLLHQSPSLRMLRRLRRIHSLGTGLSRRVLLCTSRTISIRSSRLRLLKLPLLVRCFSFYPLSHNGDIFSTLINGY